ncbi:MAG: hypothetical protein O3C10_13595 [Chloroflexi bacterium]|nr:hypothetical protein [Chloroflexota bacterium]
MIDPLEAARVLARERGGAIVVPHPSNELYWSAVSDAPDLDFLPPQTDGEVAAFSLGLAMARPDDRFIILDTDEGLLSSLGTLVTISDAEPTNLVHVVFQSGKRQGAACLPLPGADRTDFGLLALGAGYTNAHQFDDLEELASEASRIIAAPGPTMVIVKIGPPGRAHNIADPPRRYDMTDAVRRYRDTLSGR